MTQPNVDETDRRILRHLIRDARQPVAGLARTLGLSESAVRRRIDNLISQDVIQRFTVALDYEKIGYPITVMVGVQVGAMPGPDAAKALRGIENIVDVFTVTGEFDLLLRIICQDIRCFEQIIEQVRNQPFVEQTRSFVVINKIRDGFFDNIIKLSD
ncbi:MAG: Lrp/AsnC family transcriptional regulator [Candidatus Thorarchaeota archaeon]